MDREVTRIVLVDDHILFRIGLRSALEQCDTPLEIVGEAGSGRQLFEVLQGCMVDMVLLDIVLPEMSGIDIASKLRVEYPEIKILMLSAESDQETICRLMDIGIDGFVSKTVPVDELCRAVEYVADGAEYFGRDIARIIHDVRIAKSHQSTDFTPRENEIIEMCACGLSAKEIADKVHISIKTVESHKNNIFKKLGINNSVELVRYALKTGIIKL